MFEKIAPNGPSTGASFSTGNYGRKFPSIIAHKNLNSLQYIIMGHKGGAGQFEQFLSNGTVGWKLDLGS